MTPKELHDELKRLAEKASEDCCCFCKRERAHCIHARYPDHPHIEHPAVHKFQPDVEPLVVSLRNNLPTILRALSALEALEGVKGALEQAVDWADRHGKEPDWLEDARSALSKLKEAGL